MTCLAHQERNKKNITSKNYMFSKAFAKAECTP